MKVALLLSGLARKVEEGVNILVLSDSLYPLSVDKIFLPPLFISNKINFKFHFTLPPS